MNDVAKEIAQIAREKFDYAEVSIEAPGARPERNWQKIKELIKKNELKVVGSTDYHLQFASPWTSVRKASLAEIKKAFPILETLGAEFVHVHPDSSAFRDKGALFELNNEAVRELLEVATKHGLKLMVENGSPHQGGIELIKFLMEKNPRIYLNLDIGHANIGVEENLTPKFLKLFGKRLGNVHAHDNDSTRDQHLEMGKGNIDWKKIVNMLKMASYNRTVTFETFNPEGGFVRSKNLFRKMWNER